MERRKFLLTSLLASPLAGLAKFNLVAEKETSDRPDKGIVVKANESRFFGKKTLPKGTYGRCILSSTDTEKQLFISSGTDLTYKKKGGPPLHIHHKDDEVFYVISGEFLFQMDDEFILAKTGDTVFCPRGSAHTFSNPIENNPGNMLIVHQPISPELEKFYDIFFQDGYLSENHLKELLTADELKTLMTNNPFVGPPIDIDAALAKLKG